METRTGTGFDVHAFAPGDQVILCGVAVPHEARLLGHSDADVALHAVTDAVLGALAAGDIGSHFPPTDPRWQGADSARFLVHAVDLATARGGSVVHVDLTILCLRPVLDAGQLDAMRTRLAALLRLPTARVGLRRSGLAGLGFAGRGEGIAAQASATVRIAA